MNRETVELEEIIDGILQELSLMYGVDRDVILKIVSDYAEMLSSYLTWALVIHKN